MKFDEFVCTEAIKSELLAVDKQAVIHEMAQALLDAGKMAEKDYQPIVDAILEREARGSTGMGRGAAVPHATYPGTDRTVATVAISRRGVDFDSLDGKAVHVFFLLISPSDQPNEHLRALEATAQQLRKDTFCRFLKQARTVDEVKQLLDESDDMQL